MPAGQPLPLAEIFEPLFSAITGAMTLERASAASAMVAWGRPAAVVTWYYAVYASVRAMLAANGQLVRETHSATMKAYANNLRPKLPHPLNIRSSCPHTRELDNTTSSAPSPGHPRLLEGCFSSTFLEHQNGTFRELKQRYLRKISSVISEPRARGQYVTADCRTRFHFCIALLDTGARRITGTLFT